MRLGMSLLPGAVASLLAALLTFICRAAVRSFRRRA
jgi:hypothetical protein